MVLFSWELLCKKGNTGDASIIYRPQPTYCTGTSNWQETHCLSEALCFIWQLISKFLLLLVLGLLVLHVWCLNEGEDIAHLFWCAVSLLNQPYSTLHRQFVVSLLPHPLLHDLWISSANVVFQLNPKAYQLTNFV